MRDWNSFKIDSRDYRWSSSSEANFLANIDGIPLALPPTRAIAVHWRVFSEVNSWKSWKQCRVTERSVRSVISWIWGNWIFSCKRNEKVTRKSPSPYLLLKQSETFLGNENARCNEEGINNWWEHLCRTENQPLTKTHEKGHNYGIFYHHIHSVTYDYPKCC